MRTISPSAAIVDTVADTVPAEIINRYMKQGWQRRSMPAECPLLQSALHYAAQGWRVIPNYRPRLEIDGCSCGKPNCDSIGKHPQGKKWNERATTDEKQIREWYSDNSNNIGIACGSGSGIFYMDVDPRHGGDLTLDDLEAEHGALPDTPSRCGRLGFIFRYPTDRIIGTKVGIAQGIDVRGEGGQFVVHPSMHRSGEQYEWEGRELPTMDDVADAPEWLLNMIAPANQTQQQNQKPQEEQEQSIDEGGRNDKLYRIGCAMRGRGEERAAIAIELHRVNSEKCKPPMDEDEVEKIIDSAMKRPTTKTATYPLTDIGNAEHFADAYGDDVRWVREWKCWIVWDGKRWRVDVGGKRAEAKAKRLVRVDMLDHAKGLGDDNRAAYLKHALKSQSRNAVDNLLKLASSEPNLVIDATELDADGWLFTIRNGTIDLRTGKLREHRKPDLLTKLSPVMYDRDAVPLLWERALARVFQDANGNERPELVRYFQKACGYSMTADVTEQCFFILHGVGRNGKTTIMDAIKFVMGDYAMTSPESLLMKHDRQYKTNSDDVADLFGARLAACSETNEGQRFDESKVKVLTGNSDMTAMRKFQHPFTFKASHKIWLDCNHLPKLSGADVAMKRRVKTIPFDVVIPSAEQDAKLGEKLKAEGSGMLNWLLEGQKLWREEGLNNHEPREVLAAVNDYFADNDTLGQFLRDCVVDNDAAKVESKLVYQRYKIWCSNMGLDHPLTRITLTTKMKGKGYGTTTSHGKNYIIGMELVADVEADADDAPWEQGTPQTDDRRF